MRSYVVEGITSERAFSLAMGALRSEREKARKANK
jgi:hypothetical protein